MPFKCKIYASLQLSAEILFDLDIRNTLKILQEANVFERLPIIKIRDFKNIFASSKKTKCLLLIKS